ncbi:MAG: outer membrane protein assembly factor BamC, partial [Duodenibacillus sp.]|nr:outer membrane protein assembly factor BamC [Duodenibacillus sp.]
WRRLGVAVDRAGFDVTDRDRSQGLLMVKYLDPEYEKAKRAERGFFKNVFDKNAAVDPVAYQIRVQPEGDKTRVTVTGAEGKKDETGVAPRIVNLLGEQTR